MTDRFSFQATKSGSLRIFCNGKLASTLAGSAATKLLDKLEHASLDERQMLLAKATGQFKFGNERR